jgi:Protein of unknown function (DUF1115)/RWD domain
MDRLQTLLAELELLTSAYSAEEVVIDESIVAQLTTICSEFSEVSEAEGLCPEVSFKLRLGQDSMVQYRVPKAYPDQPIRLSITQSGLNRYLQDKFLLQAREFCNDRIGEHYLFDLIQTSIDIYRDIERDHTEGNDSNNRESEKDNRQPTAIMQVLVYFHHIKSPAKKREIVDSAAELSLGGFWKEGFPGIIIIEGDSEDVQEYVRRLQRLRWQHMVVRGEKTKEIPEHSTVDGMRQLPKKLEEVGDMSELGQRCRLHGVHDLFMTAMKVFKDEEEADQSVALK